MIHRRLQLPSGLQQEVDLVAHGGAVCVSAMNEDGQLLVVRQYRAATGKWLEEIPAGRLEPGEQPLEAARRELEEETGFRARSWVQGPSFYPAVGITSELMVLFHAEGLQPAGEDRLACDDDEELEVTWRTPQELLGAEVHDAKTMLAALLAQGLSQPEPGR